MKLIHIPTEDGTWELYGRRLDSIDNDRRDRPRWAEIELLQYFDTNPAHDGTCPDPEWRGKYGTQVWLIHTMGHSVLYHENNSECNKGVEFPVGEFPERSEFRVEELEPCEKCQPPDLDFTRASDGGIVWGDRTPAGMLLDLEMLWHTVVPCPVPESVLAGLRRPVKTPCVTCGGEGKTLAGVCGACKGKGLILGALTLTSPGKRLLQKVKFKDPAIRRATQETVQL
jgi:hypothetical protein